MRMHPGVIQPAPAAPSAPPAAAPAPALRSKSAGKAAATLAARYEAATSWGTLRIAIDGPAGTLRHAIDAALALDRIEPLLAALDDWCHEPLDWQWSGAAAPRMAAGSVVTVQWRSGIQNVEARVVMPWALLREHDEPPPELAAQMLWPDLAAVLAVAWPRIPPDELAWVEPGGAVVLPESMQPEWEARLRAADEAALRPAPGVPVSLERPQAPRLLAGAPRGHETSPVPDERIDCEVRLALPQAVSATVLAGWRAGLSLGEAGPIASLWRLSGEGTAQCVALGRLMPWGDGWALAIEALRKPGRTRTRGMTAGGAASAGVMSSH